QGGGSGGGGGGGGGGGVGKGGNKNIPTITLQSTLSSTGAGAATISLSGGIMSSACTSSLDVSDDFSFKIGKFKSITLGAGDITTFALSGNIAVKARPAAGQKTAKA